MAARVVVMRKVSDVGERDATRTGARNLGSCGRFQMRNESSEVNQCGFPCCSIMGEGEGERRSTVFDKRR